MVLNYLGDSKVPITGPIHTTCLASMRSKKRIAANTVFTAKISVRDNKRHMQFLNTFRFWSNFRSLMREFQTKFDFF